MRGCVRVASDPFLSISLSRSLYVTIRCVVVAYYKGREVVHVGGGVHRPCSAGLPRAAKGVNAASGSIKSDIPAAVASVWAPVEADTRFMVQSVTKGVVACGVGALVDKGLLDYDQTVGDAELETSLRGWRVHVYESMYSLLCDSGKTVNVRELASSLVVQVPLLA